MSPINPGHLDTWSPVGGCLWRIRRGGLAGGRMSWGGGNTGFRVPMPLLLSASCLWFETGVLICSCHHSSALPSWTIAF